eukprot:2259737-Pyramimonas_sp.AAC.1
MPSFTVLRHDRGIETRLTAVSPAMVRSLLKRAVVKTLEWNLGARLNVGRACGDGILSWLRSRKIARSRK